MNYQLRLPKSLGLSGLFQKLMEAVKPAVGYDLEQDMRGAIARDLEKHLIGVNTCACTTPCDAPVLPSAWNLAFEPFLLGKTDTDRDQVLRLQLDLPGESLEQFAAGMANFLDGHFNDGGAERRSAIAAAVYRTLAPYTFVGDVCRSAVLETGAEHTPVKILHYQLA